MRKGPILFAFFMCLAVLLSGCGGGGGEEAIKMPLNLSIDRTSLPIATIGIPYNQTVYLQASGRTAPYSYSCSLSSGTGISTSVTPAEPTSGGAACVISGTPSTIGKVTIFFSVTDGTNEHSSDAGPLSVSISNWYGVYPLPQDNSLYGAGFGNGIFVAVGSLGTIVRSIDAVFWTTQSSLTDNDLHGVTYGNGTFVAVGYNGTILTSSDGSTWTARNSGTTEDLYSVAYGNGTFVAVGYNGTILTSSYGSTWTVRNSGRTNSMNSVAYGNGLFAIVGGEASKTSYFFTMTSPDGVTWTNRTFEFGEGVLNGVIYAEGQFSAFGTDARVLMSADGVTWTSSSNYSGIHAMAYGNEIFMALAYGSILSSSDGINWKVIEPDPSTGLNNIIYGAGTFVAVGDKGAIIRSGPEN